MIDINLRKTLFLILPIGCCMPFLTVNMSLAGQDAPAPLESQFVLPRADLYLRGAPVVVNFTTCNAYDQPIILEFGGVEHDFSFAADRKGDNYVAEPCEKSRPGGGLTPLYRLEPGETLCKRIIINNYLSLKEPGDYRVLCRVLLVVDRIGQRDVREEGIEFRVSQELHVRLRPYNKESVENDAKELGVLVGGPEPSSRRDAVERLRFVEPSIARPYLVSALSSDDDLVRASAVEALSRSEDKESVHVILRALEGADSGSTTRLAVANALRRIGRGDIAASVAALRILLNDKLSHTRSAALKAIVDVAADTEYAEGLTEDVKRMTSDPNRTVRKRAAEALSALGHGE